MKTLYSTSATATGGGRDGRSATTDGNLAVSLVVPKELGGAGGDGTNPEQLFAVGYAACFLGALRFAAGKARIAVPADASVTSSVGIGPRDDGTGFSIEVALEVSLPGMERAAAEDLVARAHVVCPYSEATRGNLDVKLTTVV
ncbi:OsmC family protein [Methylopila jiangsuensis]|uniref:OsmC family protein n=1 Tax=Methylopila jiangsuensis TaxID=586230 RepID=A0A9W6N3P0_9HYPH|nr:organic hydroperoxide resistance protein [Methylopila jiangsuensis]MDR6286419.1 Ohr subfamily peroxiredoxin [Methylopila jiangsuensis]GLK77244.1 OsmC family protein [Methylopila jiangsuensis]